MKTICLLPLIFLTACSSTPKLALRPLPPTSTPDTVRFPEVIRAYHFGRYVDPHDDLVMHEQHTVYRVEENTRWDLRSLRTATIGASAAPGSPSFPSRDAAFSPLPVNDAVLAEVNAQKLATAQIRQEEENLSAALTQFQTALQQTKTNLQQTAELHVAIDTMQKRLTALETAPAQASSLYTTNEPTDSLNP